ncbi:HNH endonuclease [Leclercia sp.]|uniref:HNH endonuclease n=1 Tax=Leclercia sp. TaxID=1898428 RepID=UPI002897AE15|nr:HNH endonuclease [Leclercia sp.]
MTIAKSLSQKISHIKTAWYGNAPALNKPLLILYILSQYKKGHVRLFHFQTEIQQQLRDLLKRYGPKRRNYEVLMPFWLLKKDRFWSLECTNHLLFESPDVPSLKKAVDSNLSGGFDVTSFSLLQNQMSLIDVLAQQVLEQYLPNEFHSELRYELGFKRSEQIAEAVDPFDRFDLIQQDLDLINKDLSLSDTTRTSLIQARIGQGAFRANCLQIYPTCPVTGISFQPLLIASHIKPWTDCRTAQERLDPYNGIMLAAHIDTLFDSGWISFANQGEVLISNQLDFGTCERLRLPERITALSEQSFNYLKWHREHVFKG